MKYQLEVLHPMNSHIIRYYINQIVELVHKIWDEESLRPSQVNMFEFNHTKVKVITPYTKGNDND